MTPFTDAASWNLWLIVSTTIVAALISVMIRCTLLSTTDRTKDATPAEVVAAITMQPLAIVAVGVVFYAEARVAYAIDAGSGSLATDAVLTGFAWLAGIGTVALAVRHMARRSVRRRSRSLDAPHTVQGQESL